MAEVEKDEEHGGLNLKGKPLLFSGTGAPEKGSPPCNPHATPPFAYSNVTGTYFYVSIIRPVH